MAKNAIIEPWERQPGEGPKAYEAFSMYRELGTERSIQKVANLCSKDSSLLRRWSSKWSWRERIRAWDNELLRKAQLQAEKDVADMVKRHLAISIVMQNKGFNVLKARGENEMSFRDAKELLKTGIDIERLTRGEPTECIEGKNEITGVVQTYDPYNGLTTEELRKLIRLADESGD